MKSPQYLLMLFSFICLSGLSAENDSTTEHAVGVKMHYGFVIPHHSFIEYIVNSHLYAVELNYSMSGKGYWDSLYYKPERGFGLMYSELGNNQVLGQSFALFGYCNYNIMHSRNDRFRADFRIGTGLGYITKIFDVYKNNEDLIISSHINAQINLGLECKYRLSSGSIVSIGGRLTHFSNGKLSAPNYGINIFTANAGFSYNLGQRPRLGKTFRKMPEKGWIFEGIASGGLTHISAQLPGKYPIASVNLCAYRQYHPKYRWGLGADIFYNQANYTDMMSKNIYYWEKQEIYHKSDNWSAGIHLAHEFCHSRFTYSVQIGTYLKSTIYGLGGLYHRIGLKYSINDHLLLNVSVKTHWAVAEFVEWGIGYRIYKERKR